MHAALARRDRAAVAVTALILGSVFAAHAVLAVQSAGQGVWPPWCLYAMLMAAFHALEYLVTAWYHPDTVTHEAFLIDHSAQYQAALVAGWLEFWVERWLAPGMKSLSLPSAAGLALALAGQAMRTAAMVTAGRNFTHRIAAHRRPAHRLVTWGPYAFLRHPSYTGWFYWSFATQLLLANPLCTLAYALAAWSFFRHRIPYEEEQLCRFFGREYVRYAKRTYVAIPFLRAPAAGMALEESHDEDGGSDR